MASPPGKPQVVVFLFLPLSILLCAFSSQRGSGKNYGFLACSISFPCSEERNDGFLAFDCFMVAFYQFELTMSFITKFLNEILSAQSHMEAQSRKNKGPEFYTVSQSSDSLVCDFFFNFFLGICLLILFYFGDKGLNV